jgi:sn-glycerol 3-phosphate transport system ATP-binding protein
MNAGVAEQIGTPLDVYERPATVFAAQFIGSPAMNVLPARAKGRVVRLTNGIEIETGTEASGDVLLGLRPEHMERDPQGPIALDIRMAEPLGANTLLHGSLEGIAQEVVVSLPGVHREDVMAGAARFRIAPEACHLFDAGTGRRI